MRSVDGIDGPPAGEAGPPCAHTDSTAPAREGRGLQSPPYGVPSTALLARADRGFARFLGRHGEDQDDGADGSEDPQR
ncbi:hypothetical protein [Streptomyces sp. NBC_00539]|uniref:hypothetical protein n=1 Tax=Streptomyces sp. NBC_00539 TaxID=2975770 RepID=UPI002E81837A|nr:hypothetical protein [Streptomyces sp. NBC_00539]WUC62772.1 hypothetical protein OG861_00210 [Streptomyces sp. NBC_00539]